MSDQLLRQLDDKLKAAHLKALALSSEALDVLGASRTEALKARTEWLKEFDKLSTEYTDEIRKIGGDAPALNQERCRLVTALDAVEKELLAKRQLAERLRPTAEHRIVVLDQLDQRRADYTEARRQRVHRRLPTAHAGSSDKRLLKTDRDPQGCDPAGSTEALPRSCSAG